MKKVFDFRLAAVLIIFVLSGCSSLWERTVYERSPHQVQEDGVAAAALTANSRETLKSAIIGVISRGERQADIRVTDYPGGLTSPYITALLHEIQTREPIGAYAVEYIHFDLTSVLSQHTITLNIVYDEERPPITQVSGRGGLEEAVWAALADYQPRLAVEMHYYNAQEHDAEDVVQSFYYNNPAWAVEYPEVGLTLYPASKEAPIGITKDSLHRIVELELIWQTNAEDLKQKAEEADEAAQQLLRGLPEFFGDSEDQEAQKVLWLHDTLCDTVLYDHDNDAAMLAATAGERKLGDSYTAYGALVNGLAAREGYAMAFKLLCDMADIECLVVPGRRFGEEELWNLVKIGEVWYHISAGLNNIGPDIVYDFFLLNDEAADIYFQWDKNLVPYALAGLWTHKAIRDLAR